jgi:hypothetical protein
MLRNYFFSHELHEWTQIGKGFTFFSFVTIRDIRGLAYPEMSHELHE